MKFALADICTSLALSVAMFATPAASNPVSQTFQGASGHDIHWQKWEVAGSTASVIIVHGLKDHLGRYQELVEALNQQGFSVYGLDLEGHGRSGGTPAYVETFDRYLSDLQTLQGIVEKDHPNQPLYFFGHSMGGGIVARYVLENQDQKNIRGMVLSAPALKPGDDVNKLLLTATRVLSWAAPKLGALDLDNSLFSRDQDVVQGMAEDPLVHNIKVPARTAWEILRNIESINELASGLQVPVLLLHGSADQITNPEGSKEFFEKVQVEHKTLKVYDDYYHDLLHEPEHLHILDDVIGWLDQVHMEN